MNGFGHEALILKLRFHLARTVPSQIHMSETHDFFDIRHLIVQILPREQELNQKAGGFLRLQYPYVKTPQGLVLPHLGDHNRTGQKRMGLRY